MEFKDRLVQLRKENNISREELANKLNLSYSAISKYETGARTPDDDIKKRIAEYFNVSLDYLMGVSDIRNPYETDEKYSKSEDLIEYIMNEAEKHGFNLRNKSKEEIAKIIVKALKIDEISKSN